MSFKRHVAKESPSRGSRGHARGPDFPGNRRLAERIDTLEFRRACDRFMVDRIPGYVVMDAGGHRYPRP